MSVVTIILGAIAGFLVYWAGIVSLIGFFGWKPLAARYPAERWPEGEGVRVGWASGSVAMSNYTGVLNAVVTADGLYLRPIRAFAYNHAPVFIPWTAVEEVTPRLFSGIALRLAEGKGIRLSGRLAKTVQEAHAVWEDAHAGSPRLGALDDEGETNASPASWRRSRTR